MIKKTPPTNTVKTSATSTSSDIRELQTDVSLASDVNSREKQRVLLSKKVAENAKYKELIKDFLKAYQIAAKGILLKEIEICHPVYIWTQEVNEIIEEIIKAQKKEQNEEVTSLCQKWYQGNVDTKLADLENYYLAISQNVRTVVNGQISELRTAFPQFNDKLLRYELDDTDVVKLQNILKSKASAVHTATGILSMHQRMTLDAFNVAFKTGNDSSDGDWVMTGIATIISLPLAMFSGARNIMNESKKEEIADLLQKKYAYEHETMCQHYNKLNECVLQYMEETKASLTEKMNKTYEFFMSFIDYLSNTDADLKAYYNLQTKATKEKSNLDDNTKALFKLAYDDIKSDKSIPKPIMKIIKNNFESSGVI